MVLQQKIHNRVWGRGDAGEVVTVTIADQSHKTTVATDGDWSVTLEPLPVGGPYELSVEGKNQLTISDILVGEVWVCSGQSNMQWRLDQSSEGDLDVLAANEPEIRLINYPNVGAKSAVWNHGGRVWEVCTPETSKDTTAVGYYFAKQLHETLDVPIGIINNAWPGSAADAWVQPDVLAKSGQYDKLLASWKEMDAKYDDLSKREGLNEQEQSELASLRKLVGGNQRPGNAYFGVLKSHLGYGIRGVIWYQGESNVNRAYQYRTLFPLLIQSWREEWGQGDFPFYWVQLADFDAESNEPSESSWAELREAQTMALKVLPNVGQAVIIDIGEGKDIHPRNKETVAKRLARIALARDYGFDVAYQSPTFKSMESDGNQIILSFEHVNGKWRTFDVARPVGFAIAGEDRKFVWAEAKILEDQRIAVSSPEVAEPKSVRYAWANNPVCNVFDSVGLPLTPFRTDDWPGITADAVE